MYLKTQIENLLRLAQEQEPYEPYGETLQYVSLNGSQYFDTEVTPNPNLKIDVTFRTTGSDLSQNRCVFGGRISVSGSDRKATAFWNIVAASGGYMRADYGNLSSGTSDIGTSSSTIDTWTNIVMDKDKVYLNGTLKFTFSNSFVAGTNPCSIIIGGMRSGTSSSSSTANFFIGDIQQAKIWDNDVLIRDYVPKLDIQLRPCLYDKVSKTFLYAKSSSGGTTTYDLGFKRWNKYDVDYIENTGTAYIPFDDITPSSATGMNIEYAYIANDTGSAGVIGTYYSGSGARRDCLFVTTSVGNTQIANNNPVMLISCGNSIGSSSIAGQNFPPEVGKWYNAQINWLNSGELYWTDGTNEMSGNNGTNTPVTQQLRLFSRYSTGSSSYGNCKARCRKLQFSEGTEIIRSYIPVIWHNGNTTAIATLYDEVYNKMTTPTGTLKAYILGAETTVYTLADISTDVQDYYLAEDGTKTTSSDHTSCYTKAFPVKEGDIVEWTVTAEAVTANKRIHGYSTNADITAGQKGSWVEMLAKIVFSTTSDTTQKASFVVPSGVNYIRLSHANVRETQCKITVTTPYEVGMYVQTLKNSATANAGYVIELNEYPQDGMGYHIKTTTTSDNSNYAFGSRKTSSGNLQLVTLSGSSTGSTILSTVMGASITWKSENTNWVRTNNANTTYETSIQTYKDGDTYKFNAIGYNYTLGKEADRQTQPYSSSIDSEQGNPMLYFGAFNTLNILYGNNTHYFFEWNLPDIRHTLLPVINSTHTQFCFIDNKSKEIYEFTKVGAPSPTANNVNFKQLDGTILTGTLT